MTDRFARAAKTMPEPPKSLPMRLMPLMKTGRRWCKFPVKDNAKAIGGYLCCCRATMPDDVYCAEHRAIATSTRPAALFALNK